MRFDFSYEASNGVSVADLEKVETLVSGLHGKWSRGHKVHIGAQLELERVSMQREGEI